MQSATCPNRSHAPPVMRRALCAALLLALPPIEASAATIIVTSPDDTTTAAIDTCTLRQAIMSMDAGGLVGACHKNGDAFGVDDTITFAASAISGATTPGTVTLADSADPNGGLGGMLVISDNRLTLDGSAWRGDGEGHYVDGVTIARPAGASHRFGILKDTAPAGGLLTLKGIAIRNGYSFGGYSFGGSGGGIAMDAADLTMSDSRVSGGRANYGGGIWSPGGAVTLTGCTIDGNAANGGGVYAGSGAVTVTASTISGNGVWNLSDGGGIHAGGDLIVVDSTISGNLGKRGAGIQVGGTLTLIRSDVANNDAYYSGSGIHVLAGATATVSASAIHGNHARYNGGGVYSLGNLTVTNSTIAGNGARGGGAIAVRGAATLHLDHATLAQNGVSTTGGGVGYVTWPYGPPWTGSATIDHSIIAGNAQGSGTDVDLGDAWNGSGNLISDPAAAALGPLQDNGGPTPTMLPGPASAALDAIAPQDCTQSVDRRGVPRPWGAGCDIGAVEVFVDRIFANGFEASPTLRAID